MGLLTQVEMPGGSVESYVMSLDRCCKATIPCRASCDATSRTSRSCPERLIVVCVCVCLLSTQGASTQDRRGQQVARAAPGVPAAPQGGGDPQQDVPHVMSAILGP